MATSVNLGFCLWLAGATFNDSVGRNQGVAGSVYLGASQGGVLMSTTNPLFSTWTSALSFTVAPGTGVVPSNAGDGAYQVENPTVQTLTCTTADPTNPRIDLVALQVVDNGNNTSFAEIIIVPGTPASSPAVPATPTNAIALCNIRVNAGVTVLAQNNFTDVRVFTAFAGGIVVCPNMASLPSGYPGAVGYDVVNNRLFFLTQSGAAPLRVKSNPPAETVVTTNQAYTSGVEKTLASVNFTADGSDYTFTGQFPLGASNAASGVLGLFRLYLDSTKIQENVLAPSQIAGTWWYSASVITHTTSASKGTTPSVGAHTVSLRVLIGDNGTVFATGTNTIDLYVVGAIL